VSHGRGGAAPPQRIFIHEHAPERPGNHGSCGIIIWGVHLSSFELLSDVEFF